MGSSVNETLTFMFTDIEGSTKLWDGFPDAMDDALRRQLQIIGAAVADHNGHLVRERGEGDSTFSVFAKARDALRAAAQIQTQLGRTEWSTPTPVRTRIALHAGAGRPYERDYNSSAVNRCARIRSLAKGGQTLVSRACAELALDELPADMELLDLGVHALRDLERPEHLYQLLHATLDRHLIGIYGEATTPQNLPSERSTFVGRKREFEEVIGLLAKCRLLTLMGVGGVGKTRLALRSAESALESFPDGVWFVELASITKGANILDTIAASIHLPLHGTVDLLSPIAGFLRQKKCLLLIDNCEHVIEECAKIVENLLGLCPRLTVLCTSREALSVQEEICWRVPMLEAGHGSNDAVRLFVERARAVTPSDFEEEALAAIGRICNALDGLPLAIELAAARCRSMSPQEIEANLGNRFALLTSGTRTAAPRQKTLQALFDWSWDLLDRKEQLALCRLALFPGGWTLDAAEHVLELARFEALDLLDRLIEKSLLIADTSGPVCRYRMLETTRSYFLVKLDETGAAERATELQRSHYVALARAADAQILHGDQKRALDRLGTEQDNVREVLRRCLANGKGIEDAIAICGCMWHLWMIKSQYREGLDWIRSLAEASSSQDDPENLSRALTSAGVLASKQGDFVESIDFHNRALAVAERAGIQKLGPILNNIGLTLYYKQEFQEAGIAYEKALRVAAQTEDLQCQSTVLSNLGNNAMARGEYAAAFEYFDASQIIRERLGDKYGLSITLNNRGNCLIKMGRFAEAEEEFEGAYRLKQELDDPEGTASVFSNWGELARYQGDLRAAMTRFCRSLEILSDMPSSRVVPILLERLAFCLFELGHDELSGRLVGTQSAFAIPEAKETPELALLRESLGAKLGPEGYSAAFRKGKNLSLKAALVLCRQLGGSRVTQIT